MFTIVFLKDITTRARVATLKNMMFTIVFLKDITTLRCIVDALSDVYNSIFKGYHNKFGCKAVGMEMFTIVFLKDITTQRHR